jgi:c(7)-type cytochrome triheme protein
MSEEAQQVRRSVTARRVVAIAAVAAACLGVLVALALSERGRPSQVEARVAPTETETLVAAAIPDPAGDFSKFNHVNAQHARLPCLLCHRRDEDSARPKLPGHMPCAGCHAQQFADPASPICGICHDDPGSGEVKRFPPLRSFDVAFDHDQHVRRGDGPRASCATCHRPSRGGVALSVPAGAAAHETCFQCHAPRAQAEGRDISSCGVCHRHGTPSRAPQTARAFGFNFAHSEHARAGLSCAACHSSRAGRSRAGDVTSPFPAMHHAPAGGRSCAACHDGKRAFGGDDFSSCARCHEGNAWRF